MMESLEQRCLMSVALDHGVLTIIGTASDDQYALTSDGRDILVNEHGVSSRFLRLLVSSIDARLLGGNDRFDMSGLSIPATVFGGRGQDTIYGGQSNDVIHGGRGDDLLVGGPGDDQLYGERGNDVLYGQQGRDTLQGGYGNNHLYGGRGADSLIGDVAGISSMDGGAGTDQIQYDPDFDTINRPDLRDSFLRLHRPYQPTPTPPDPGISTSADQTVVGGNNQFAWDLYAQLRRQQGNLFFSPLSVSAALSMTALGARGQTADEMLDVLHLQGTSPEAFGELMSQLQSNVPGQPKVTLADAIWARYGLQLQDDFVNSVQTNYGSTVGNLNFAGNPTGAADTINQWASANTNGRIQQIVQPSDVKDSAMVLANAVYFLGHWAHPFDPQATRNGTFTTNSGAQITTPLMHEEAYLPYYDGGTFKALELPYEGDGMSMMVLLPDQPGGIGALEQQLTAGNLASWDAQMTTENVAVTLPKFNITTPTFSLTQQLQQLGMVQAFTGSADFSGITTQQSLCISSVLQKAYVTVAEKGTEAAAVTVVVVAPTFIMPSVPTVTFNADHPFVFVIKDNHTGSTLFAGRVTQPTAPTAAQEVPG